MPEQEPRPGHEHLHQPDSHTSSILDHDASLRTKGEIDEPPQKPRRFMTARILLPSYATIATAYAGGVIELSPTTNFVVSAAAGMYAVGAIVALERSSLPDSLK